MKVVLFFCSCCYWLFCCLSFDVFLLLTRVPFWIGWVVARRRIARLLCFVLHWLDGTHLKCEGRQRDAGARPPVRLGSRSSRVRLSNTRLSPPGHHTHTCAPPTSHTWVPPTSHTCAPATTHTPAPDGWTTVPSAATLSTRLSQKNRC